MPSHDKGRNRCIDHPRKSAQPHSADTYLQRQPYLILLSPLRFLDAVFLQSLQKPANLTDRFEPRTLRSIRPFCVWSLEFCDFPTIVSPRSKCKTQNAKPKTETTSDSGTEQGPEVTHHADHRNGQRCLGATGLRRLRHWYSILHLRGRKDAPVPLRLFRHLMELARGRGWCHCLKASVLLRVMDSCSDLRFKRVQRSLAEEVEE